MKEYVIIVAIVAATASGGEVCPPEQATDWSIEKLLPHEHCDKFYKCTYGVPVSQDCPDGLYYSIKDEQCEYTWNVDCNGRKVPTTKPEPEAPIYPNPNPPNPKEEDDYLNKCPQEQITDWNIEKLLPHEDCDKFYKCTYGVPVSQDCPNGLYYSIEDEQCEYTWYVDCNGRKVPTTKPEPEAPIYPNPNPPNPKEEDDYFNKCPQEQITDWSIEKLLPHEDCDKFYKCTYGVPVTQDCPNGLYYSIKDEQCEYTWNVDCNGRKIPNKKLESVKPINPGLPDIEEDKTSVNECPPEQITDWSIEKLLPHEDCDKFYKCTYGVPITKDCPDGLYYSIKDELCQYISTVDCNGRKIPNKKPESVEPTNPNPNEGENLNKCPPEQAINWANEKLLPHEDCDKFYKCTYGVPIVKDCPEGLLYDEEKEQCEWPKTVKCGLRKLPADKK